MPACFLFGWRQAFRRHYPVFHIIPEVFMKKFLSTLATAALLASLALTPAFAMDAGKYGDMQKSGGMQSGDMQKDDMKSGDMNTGGMKQDVDWCRVFLDTETGSDARAGIGRWIAFYNQTRPHSSLGGRTPDNQYHQGILKAA
jgi:pentapeptide MXKDX repeat protein